MASPARRATEAWVANLEGCSLPDEPQGATCRNVAGLCLGIAPRHLQVLKGAPFAALSVENNHSQDFGPDAAAATRQALRTLGILPLHEASPLAAASSVLGPPTERAQNGSPRVAGLYDPSDEAGSVQWLTQGDVTWGLVAVNLINRTSAEVDAALLRARLRIGLARARTPWVAVLPHWGREYDAQGGRSEWELSERFARWGARLVVGSHPHVIGDRRCGPTVAAYYSLGNLLFDQPLPATQRGLALRCCVRDGAQLDCRGFQTLRPPGSLWPRLAHEDPQQACRLDLPPPQAPEQPPPTPSDLAPDTAWLRHPKAASLLFVQPFRSLGPQHFFSLRRLYSRFDDEQALRPYVFAIKGGRVVDVWRGTALSWPLLFARLLQLPDGRERLCALHRGDSFVRRDPQIPASRRFHAVYAWSGFGFARVDDAEALALCQQH